MAPPTKEMPNLPADVKLALHTGYEVPIESNSENFLQWLRNRPRRQWEDWKDGFRRGDPSQSTTLQLCVYLQEYLEELDATEEDIKDQQGHTTAVLNAEFLIFDLTRRMPLRYNPFLPHWVNTAVKIQRELAASRVPGLWQARLELIRLAIASVGVEDGLQERPGLIEKHTPDQMLKLVTREPAMIDLTPSVQMMEQQGLPLSKTVRDYLVTVGLQPPEGQQASSGKNMRQAHSGTVSPSMQHDLFKNLLKLATEDVYHNKAASQLSNGSLLSPDIVSPLEAATAQTKGKAPVPQLIPITSRSNLDVIKHALEINPEETSHALSRLPLDLASLDLLTKVLDSDILATSAPLLKSATITREYIQHCLRIIERTGDTFSPTSDSGFDERQDDGPKGKEEQIRGVKLLVMFMRNLLRKDKLPVPELRFDIEEICVRYLWISEVRDFKKVIEGDDMITSNGYGQEQLPAGG